MVLGTIQGNQCSNVLGLFYRYAPMDDHYFSVRVSVQQATGGPVMNVEGPAAMKGRLWCTWKEGALHYGAAFAKSSLVIVDVDFEKVYHEWKTESVEYGQRVA